MFQTYLAYFFLTLSVFLLIAASYLDFKDQEVDWRILVFALLSSLIFGVFGIGTSNLLPGISSAVIVPLVLVVISREKWMGWGDVLFASCVGLILGYPYSLIAVMIAFLAGAVFGIIYLKLRVKEKTLPFGPFLTFGGIVMLIAGKEILKFLEGLL